MRIFLLPSDFFFFFYGAKYYTLDTRLYPTLSYFPLRILALTVQPSNLTLSIQIILSLKKPEAFPLKREISSEIVVAPILTKERVSSRGRIVYISWQIS